MPRRLGTKPIYYQLPEDHPALSALDAYCKERDKSRADASKDIVIAWARARQGDLSALSGLLGIALGTGPEASTAIATPTRPGKQDDLSLEKVRKARTMSQGERSQYAEIWYWASPSVCKQVQRACARLVEQGDLSLEEAERIFVRGYPLTKG